MDEGKQDRIIEYLERLDERLRRIESALYPERPTWADQVREQPPPPQQIFTPPLILDLPGPIS